MTRKCIIIYNPISGSASISKLELLEMAAVEIPEWSVRILETTGEHDDSKILANYEEYRPGLVVVGGGDGTVRLVAKSLEFKNVPLCIIPLGSANGLAKCLGIDNLADAWQAIRDFKLDKIDAIFINDKLCLHLADFGINANLIQKFEKEETRGMFGYVKNSLSEIFGTQSRSFQLKIGTESIDIIAKMVVIANGDRYGTGAIINSRGIIDDGKFEIIALNPETAEDYLRMTMAFIKGDLDQVEGVQSWSVEECQLSNPEGAGFQIDGEMIENTDYVTVKIQKQAFLFLTGQSFIAGLQG